MKAVENESFLYGHNIPAYTQNIVKEKNGRWEALYTQKLTSEKMIFCTALLHKLVYQQPVIIFKAVTNELHKIRMGKLPQVVDLSLYVQNISLANYAESSHNPTRRNVWFKHIQLTD